MIDARFFCVYFCPQKSRMKKQQIFKGLMALSLMFAIVLSAGAQNRIPLNQSVVNVKDLTITEKRNLLELYTIPGVWIVDNYVFTPAELFARSEGVDIEVNTYNIDLTTMQFSIAWYADAEANNAIRVIPVKATLSPKATIDITAKKATRTVNFKTDNAIEFDHYYRVIIGGKVSNNVGRIGAVLAQPR